MTVEFTTNNVPRFVLDAYELTEKERAEFDYIDWDAIARGEDSATFIRYRGWTYDLGDFMRTNEIGLPDEFREWDGYVSDTFFSGIVVKYAREDNGDIDPERVIMGRYFVAD